MEYLFVHQLYSYYVLNTILKEQRENIINWHITSLVRCDPLILYHDVEIQMKASKVLIKGIFINPLCVSYYQ